MASASEVQNGAPNPAISLIIVSRDRPDALATALNCLRFQTATSFETIVVSNLPRPDGPAPAPLLHVDCQPANISLARNIGLALARGALIVFCDDDCLPEPRFLERIAAPFQDPKVGAAGGITRGTNGVGRQWQATGFGRDGVDFSLKIDRAAPFTTFPPHPERFVKTIGTACAFRADALRAIGGFDEGYRYYYDETDVNLRLSEAGWSTAIVPQAQVHHAFAAGPHRDRRQMPRDMFENGVSTGRFCRLHVKDNLDAALGLQRRSLRRRLQGYHLVGLISGPRLRFLLARLDEGLAASRAQTPGSPASHPLGVPGPAIKQTTAQQRLHFLLEGRRAAMRPLAKALSNAGHVVTVLDISLSARPLWAFFDEDGFWYHRGGLLGKTHRSGPLVQFRTKSAYIAQEVARLAGFRRVNYLIQDNKSAGPAVILPELANISEIEAMTVLDMRSDAE